MKNYGVFWFFKIAVFVLFVVFSIFLPFYTVCSLFLFVFSVFLLSSRICPQIENINYDLNLFIPRPGVRLFFVFVICLPSFFIGLFYYYYPYSYQLIDGFLKNTQYESYRSFFLEAGVPSVEHYDSLFVVTYFMDVTGIGYVSSVMVGLFFQYDFFKETEGECAFYDGKRKRNFKAFSILFVFSVIVFLLLNFIPFKLLEDDERDIFTLLYMDFFVAIFVQFVVFYSAVSMLRISMVRVVFYLLRLKEFLNK